MTPELQRFYNEAFSMMSSQGWKDLMEDVERVIAGYDRISSVTETHPLDFRRGQLDILNWIYGLRAAYEKTYEDLEQESEL